MVINSNGDSKTMHFFPLFITSTVAPLWLQKACKHTVNPSLQTPAPSQEQEGQTWDRGAGSRSGGAGGCGRGRGPPGDPAHPGTGDIGAPMGSGNSRRPRRLWGALKEAALHVHDCGGLEFLIFWGPEGSMRAETSSLLPPGVA